MLHEAKFNYQAHDAQRIAIAENTRRAILNLIGTPTESAKKIQWLKNKAVNSLYDKFGQGKATDIVSEWELPGLKNDPAKYLRSFAFHTTMGLFNWVQLPLQAAHFFVMSSIVGDPRIVTKSMSSYTFMRALGMTKDPRHIQAIYDKAAQMGWNMNELKELNEIWQRSGMKFVEGETAFKDDYLTPTVNVGSRIQAIGQQILDAGTIFFREGEKAVRGNALSMAYQEFRKAQPGRVMNQRDINKILARASDLSANMTRDSAAAWQRGLMSIPTQFMGYQLRMLELMWGKRLSKTEKIRMASTMSALYGVPIFGSLYTALPIYDSARAYLLESGYEGDSAWVETAMRGIPAMMLEWASDGEIKLNPGERYAPGGIPLLRDIWRGDKDFWDVVFGAAGSIVRDTYVNTVPFADTLYRVFDLEENNATSEELVQNAIRSLSMVSSVNNSLRIWRIMNEGAYYSRKGTKLADGLNFTDAVYIGLGLNPLEVSDSFAKIDVLKDEKAYKQQTEKEFIDNMRKGIKATDPDTKEMYFRNAQELWRQGKFMPQEASRLTTVIFADDSVTDNVFDQWEKRRFRDQMMGTPE
jgi:hypothetical protein